MMPVFPGRDSRAHQEPASSGADHVASPRHVVVVGGGIAGLAAAVGLGERGVTVTMVESHQELGGRVRSWEVDSPAGKVTMSRGFHAFFRQYYNLRLLLERTGPLRTQLRPLADYPVVSSSGDEDTFSKIPRTPPWNFISFVMQSPTFTGRDLVQVDIDRALSLLDVSFPETFRELSGVSAAQFLDDLKFPERARHLALEVFARSFFADPRDFSAGELVAMFHTYFLGSAEGLLFDVPRDDFDTSLWAPLGEVIASQGGTIHTGDVTHLTRDGAGWRAHLSDGEEIAADGVVIAAGPRSAPQIIAASPEIGDDEWRARVADTKLAPPFAVWRLWFDDRVNADRQPFLGTAKFGPLDNISVLEGYERGAAEWSAEHRGSVIELHAYSLPDSSPEAVDRDSLRETLRAELARVYPETREMGIVHEELLIEQDCALVGLEPWESRPGVTTPEAGVKLAGDWVRSPWPIALMERAATTGWQAANELLAEWGVAGHELWSVPLSARASWAGKARQALSKVRS